MTTFELHLSVNQRLQEVASYKRDKYRPEEIDLALNKGMYRLLEDAVKNRFQDTQIDLSQVAALIQKNKVLEIYKPGITEPLYEESIPSVYSLVPADFYWLINSRVETVTDPLNCETAPTLGTTTLTEYVTVVPFPTSPTGPPYYRYNVVQTPGTIIYTPPATISSGFNNLNSKYVWINNVIETYNRVNILSSVYWERYRNKYYRDSFIFVDKISSSTISIQDFSTSTIVSSGSTVANSYTTYNRGLIAGLTSKKVEVNPADPIQANELYQVLRQNHYYKTGYKEVIMDQNQDYFTCYTDESFLVTRFYCDYIRKPRTISLALNQSCELADTAHHKVVDLAVELLRLDIKDSSYQQTVQDTQLRTN